MTDADSALTSAEHARDQLSEAIQSIEALDKRRDELETLRHIVAEYGDLPECDRGNVGQVVSHFEAIVDMIGEYEERIVTLEAALEAS